MIEDSNGKTYKYENGEWSGEDSVIVGLLNERALLVDTTPSNPNPIGEIIKDAAKALGGKVISAPAPVYVDGTVY